MVEWLAAGFVFGQLVVGLVTRRSVRVELELELALVVE